MIVMWNGCISNQDYKQEYFLTINIIHNQLKEKLMHRAVRSKCCSLNLSDFFIFMSLSSFQDCSNLQ